MDDDRRARLGLSAAILVALATISCGKKLTQEDCTHLLGRAVGLATANEGDESAKKELGPAGQVPVDVELLRKTARGPAKKAIAEFDAACIGSDDGGAVLCGRRAKDDAEFRACGGIVAKAREAGEVARLAVARKHSVAECSAYAEHAVKIGAATADDVPAVVEDCGGWLEIGFFECRMAAKDAAAWNACDAP